MWCASSDMAGLCLDMVCSSLERPELGLWTHPKEETRAMAQESMFWEIVSENVLDAPDKRER